MFLDIQTNKELIRTYTKMCMFEKQKGSAYASRASQHYQSLEAFVQQSIRKASWQYIEGVITSKDDDNSLADDKRFKDSLQDGSLADLMSVICYNTLAGAI